MFIFLLFLIQFIITIHGTINPKYLASCVALQNETRIYCYSGGYSTLGSSLVEEAQPDHHYLDLTVETLIPGNTAPKWIDVPDDPRFILEPAIGGTPIKLSDSSYLIDGGYSINAMKRNHTILFDASTNTWSTISNNGRNSTNAIYGETGVYVTERQYIAFWGGLIGRQPGTLINNSAVLHMTLGGSWTLCLDKFNGTLSRFGHTAVYDMDGQQILYLGGRTRQVSSNPFIPMQNITIFNTVTLDWSTKRANAQVNISDRYLHTATRLPTSGLIIIYGGANGDEAAPKAVSDYLYLFNPKTFEFTKIAENNTAYSAGPRFGHSAVLCDDTIMILFGANRQGIITSDTFFLSLNGAATTWLNQFRSSVIKSPDSSFTVKDIIGITVGSVIGLILIIIALWYFIWRDKDKTIKEESINEEEPVYVMENTLHDSIPPPLNVYKPNQIVSRSSPLLEYQTIKPSL